MNKQKIFLLVTSILFIIAGITIFFYPVDNLISFSILFFIIMLIGGISELIMYIYQPVKRISYLVMAIITIVISTLMLSSGFVTLTLSIPYIFAFWILFSGTTKLMLGFEIKEISKKQSTHFIILGIIGMIIGVILLYHPLLSGFIVVYTIAIALIYQGIVYIKLIV